MNTCETTCPDCKGDENDIKISNGYHICTLCGTALKIDICENAEWSYYPDTAGNITNESRCGGIIKSTDINPYSDSIYSFIPKGVKNVCFENGKAIKYDIYKIHLKNSSNHLKKSFNIVKDYIEFNACDKYSTRVIQTAELLWADIMKTRRIIRGGVRKGLIACCVYYSCIYYDSTHSPIEICNDFGMDNTKNFNKGDKEFKEIFENSEKWSHLLSKTTSSDDYFTRLCSDLEMNLVIKERTAYELANECKEIYEKTKDNLAGIIPKSAACGIIYWVLCSKKINVKKSSISKILNICSPSFSKSCSAVFKILGAPKI